MVFFDKYNVTKEGEVIRIDKNKPLKPEVTKHGYERVTLSSNGVKKRFLVHRLVASLYLNNEEDKCCVNHIDGNKRNNCESNLEWVTHSENNQHAYDTGLSNAASGGTHYTKYRKHHNDIEVIQYSLDGDYITTFRSAAEAARQTGSLKSKIGQVCRFARKTHNGFIWKFKEET